MTTKCAKTGCDRKAEWTVYIRIPAKGFDLSSHEPVTVMADIALCRDDAETLDASAWLTTTFRERLKAEMAQQRLWEPDFDRAWAVPVRRSDPEVIEALRELRRQRR